MDSANPLKSTQRSVTFSKRASCGGSEHVVYPDHRIDDHSARRGRSARQRVAAQTAGWRLPFLLSTILVVIGAFARVSMPETAAFAERLGKLCDGPMEFRNLDVRSIEEM